MLVQVTTNCGSYIVAAASTTEGIQHVMDQLAKEGKEVRRAVAKVASLPPLKPAQIEHANG